MYINLLIEGSVKDYMMLFYFERIPVLLFIHLMMC